MSPHVGHSAGRLQTLLPHLEQRYPSLLGWEWHEQRLGWDSTVLDGKPIISNDDADLVCADVMGGVVSSIIISRKCCSFRTMV